MAINTKEQLRDYIHSIHDYIRNSGAGYGMNALKIFNVFYTLKLLEDKMVNIGFNECFDWSYIKKSINEHDFKDTVEIWIYNTINELRSICLNDNTKMHPLTQDIKNILDIVVCKNNTGKNKDLQHIENEICEILKKQTEKVKNNKKLNEYAYFMYFQLPADLKKEFIKDMFIMIDNLSFISESKNFDIRGKIYEYFIGRDKNAMSDLGAYFTDRHLTNFIMDEVDPVLDKNGNVQTMIDPFAGSGGMTLSYVTYINQKYNKSIWNKNDNYKNVFHFDMSEDVVKIAGIEYYSLTGKFPSYEKQFYRTNSFTDDEIFKNYKYLITNPPYGGDKSTKSADTINRECIIEYNKKEINNLLDKMDISPIKYKDIEKTIYKDIDKGICDFINTKESIIIKEKIEHFIEYTKKLFNEYNFDENKEEILKISRLCIQNKLYLQINAINSKKQENLQVNYNTCGSNIKQYSKKIVNDYHNIQKNLITNTIDNELLKLNKDEEFIKYKQFESYKTKLSKNPTDKIIMDELEKFADKESCSLILLMSLLDNDGVCAGVLKEGVYFDTNYSKLRGYLINNFNVSKVISVSADQFENTTTKTSIIIFKNDGKKTEKIEFYDLDIEKYSDDKIIFGDKSDFIQGLVYGNVNIEPKNKISKVNKKLISTATFDELSKVIIKYNKNNELQFDIPFSFNAKDYIKKEIIVGDGYELNNLDELCNINLGTRITKKENIEGNIPVYGGGDITFYTNKSNRNENTLIVSRYALSKTCVRLIHNNFFLNDSGLSIKSKNNNLQKYINYYLLSEYNQDYIYKNCTSGSVQKNLNMGLFHKLQIPIPKSQAKIQEWVDKISKPYDKMNSNKSKNKEAETLYKQLIKELVEEALPSNKNVSTNEINNSEHVSSNDDKSISSGDSSNGSDTEEDIKHNIVSIKDIDYIEEDGNYYSIDTNGNKVCLCYTTDANGKIKKYKDKNIIIKEPVMTMLSMSSGRNNKDILIKVPLETMLSKSSGRNNKNNM
jgi:hypothetical protein